MGQESRRSKGFDGLFNGMKGVPFIVQTCDAGNHRRKDRPNGGMYVSVGKVNLTIAAMQPQETLIVCPRKGERIEITALHKLHQ